MTYGLRHGGRMCASTQCGPSWTFINQAESLAARDVLGSPPWDTSSSLMTTTRPSRRWRRSFARTVTRLSPSRPRDADGAVRHRRIAVADRVRSTAPWSHKPPQKSLGMRFQSPQVTAPSTSRRTAFSAAIRGPCAATTRAARRTASAPAAAGCARRSRGASRRRNRTSEQRGYRRITARSAGPSVAGRTSRWSSSRRPPRCSRSRRRRSRRTPPIRARCRSRRSP